MSIRNSGADEPIVVMGAPVLALSVYALTYWVASSAAKMALGTLYYYLPIETAQQIVCSLAAMGVARLCCDRAFGGYSKRGPVILITCVAIVLAAGFLLGGLGNSDPLQFQLAWPVFTACAVYWWFGYNGPRRQPFILFIGIGLVLIACPFAAGLAGVGHDDNPILLQLGWPAFTMIAAWRWFYRRTNPLVASMATQAPDEPARQTSGQANES